MTRGWEVVSVEEARRSWEEGFGEKGAEEEEEEGREGAWKPWLELGLAVNGGSLNGRC